MRQEVIRHSIDWRAYHHVEANPWLSPFRNSSDFRPGVSSAEYTGGNSHGLMIRFCMIYATQDQVMQAVSAPTE